MSSKPKPKSFLSDLPTGTWQSYHSAIFGLRPVLLELSVWAHTPRERDFLLLASELLQL